MKKIENNKIKGIVKAVSEKNKSLLLQTKDSPDGNWWKGVDKAQEYVKKELKGNEIELTILNTEKRLFSYINTLCTEVQQSKTDGESQRLRSMALSYAKDLVVGEIIPHTEILSTAESFFNYIKKGLK